MRLCLAILTLCVCLPPVSGQSGSYFGNSRPVAPAASSLKIANADWYKDEIFYHVWLYAFNDSDKNGVGDIPGVTAKLDYLKGLGITSVWLSPFWKSPSTHGYDVVDYNTVDPRYGTEKDVVELLAAAHQRGMKVIFDFVPNHLSFQNPWFTDSRAGVNGKRNWFLWRDKPPTSGWLDFGNHSAWHSAGKAGYYYSLFWDQMPDLNYREPAVRTAMADVVTYWLNLGFDGLRIDAVKYLFENETTGANADQPETLDFFQHLRHDLLDQYTAQGSPKFMVSENWTTDLENLDSYLSSDAQTNDGFHATLDFPFGYEVSRILNGTGTVEGDLGREWENFFQKVQAEGAWTFTFLSNHDNYQSRLLSQFRTVPRARVAQALQMTLWGTPVVYYGNEVGMLGNNGNDQNMRQPFPWKRLAEQQADPNSLFTWQTQLDHLRLSHAALRRGDLNFVAAPNGVGAYVRTLGTDQVLVVVNLTSDPVTDFAVDLSSFGVSKLSTLVGPPDGASLVSGQLAVAHLRGFGVRLYQLGTTGRPLVRGDFP